MRKAILFLLLLSSLFPSCSKDDSTVSPGNGSSGQGGSLARFTIARGHLYIVDGQKLYFYSLASSRHPQLKGSIDLGWNIETIYPYTDKLFIGSQNAMYIYSIADPELPVSLGTASHVRSCDPVVANDTMAYVTVRSGSACGGTANTLFVYDIRNIMSPRQLNAIPMTSPWGLGIHDDRLYVCNGSSGLVVYDISDAIHPKVIQKITNEVCYDVIVTADGLVVAMIQGGMAIYKADATDGLVLQARISG